MFFNLSISEEEWIVQKLHSNNVLQNRTTFIHYLMSFLEYVPNQRGSASIRLPSIVTKEERHIIHKMTSPGFSSESFDLDDDRYMVVYLSASTIREYIEKNTPVQEEDDEIPDHFTVEIDNDDITVEIKEEVVLKSDKQHLFDIMINFIESNLPNQLNEYIAKNFKITKV
jgi:hypothetical protein